MKLYLIVSESFNVPIDKITDDLVIANLEEWDSMAHMYFITKIEEGFGVTLTGVDIEKMRSVNDVKHILIKIGAKDI